jgi:hypothetical protein
MLRHGNGLKKPILIKLAENCHLKQLGKICVCKKCANSAPQDVGLLWDMLSVKPVNTFK